MFISGSAYCPQPPESAQVHKIFSFSYLGQRSGVDDDFEVLGHLLQEVLGSRPLHDIDVGNVAFDVDGDRVVRVPHLVELTVHECLVQVQHQGLSAARMFRLRAQQPVGTLLVPSEIEVLSPRQYLSVVLLAVSLLWSNTTKCENLPACSRKKHSAAKLINPLCHEDLLRRIAAEI